MSTVQRQRWSSVCVCVCISSTLGYPETEQAVRAAHQLMEMSTKWYIYKTTTQYRRQPTTDDTRCKKEEKKRRETKTKKSVFTATMTIITIKFVYGINYFYILHSEAIRVDNIYFIGVHVVVIVIVVVNDDSFISFRVCVCAILANNFSFFGFRSIQFRFNFYCLSCVE